MSAKDGPMVAALAGLRRLRASGLTPDQRDLLSEVETCLEEHLSELAQVDPLGQLRQALFLPDHATPEDVLGAISILHGTPPPNELTAFEDRLLARFRAVLEEQLAPLRAALEKGTVH